MDEIKITKEMVTQFKMNRVNEFLEKFTELRNKYECDIVARPIFSEDGRVVVDLQVKVRD